MSSKVLVLNAGSSSLKFKLFDVLPAGIVASAGGLVEQIGNVERSCMKAKVLLSEDKSDRVEKIEVKTHTTALDLVLNFLKESFSASITNDMAAVGHRVVHGKTISEPALLTDDVISTIKAASDLAPLHNPPNLEGIHAAKLIFPSCPQVAVFDTAFHQTIPPAAYTYAVPQDMAKEKGIRKYGFHGISYYYLVQQASKMLNKPINQLNLIACHLGAGSSISAIRNGCSVDTSMGLTPLEGLCMATRSGDVDPAVLQYMIQHCGVKDIAAAEQLLNKKSGLLGLTGTPDLRVILEKAVQGDAQCQLALEVYVHRVRKYIGAYLVHLHGNVDGIVFSAGIGENSAPIRAAACANLQSLGIEIDADANESMVRGAQGLISTPGSQVKVLVVPTDEELSIAQQALETVEKSKLAML